MALQACAECGKEISSDAKTCPHCGKKVFNGYEYAVKVITWLIPAAFVLTMCSYLGNTDKPNIAAPAAQKVDPCPLGYFTVDKIKAVEQYGYAKLTGVVVNHCKIAAGVRLKWTATNSDGTIAFVDDFFPAHTTNIPPGTEYPFETSHHAPRGLWRFNVEPIEIISW